MIPIRKQVINCVAFLIFVFNANCQNKGTTAVPSFPGGKAELDRYLKENMKWTQSQLTVEGTVFVSFIVDSTGNIGSVKVTKSLCESCDKEAVRLVKSMPHWIPAKKEGRHINSDAMVSIPFKLSEN